MRRCTRAGAIPILMPTIQPADLWRESGRYDGYGKEMLRIRDRHERDMLYGPTNEENVTDIFRRHVKSFKQPALQIFIIFNGSSGTKSGRASVSCAAASS